MYLLAHRHGPGHRRGTIVLVTAALAAAAVVGSTAHAKSYGDWGPPDPVSPVNDPGAADGCPIEAPDGRSLFLASTRGDGPDNDIWVATRSKVDEPFSSAEMLPAPVNSDANEFCPTPLRGNRLLFVSDRGGVDPYGTIACGGGDIYITRRSPATGAWDPPRNLGCSPAGPNGPGTEFGPSVVETDNETLLFFSSGGAPGSKTQDIYMSRMEADGSFGPRDPVAELNTSDADDMMPNVRKDGRELVFASNRPGSIGGFDVYSVTRSGVDDPWSPPVNISSVNTAESETRPSLSWHGERLYFGRSGEIYVSERSS
jgi:hypothetical protein